MGAPLILKIENKGGVLTNLRKHADNLQARRDQLTSLRGGYGDHVVSEIDVELDAIHEAIRFIEENANVEM